MMKKYLYEMHTHTSEVSRCGKSPARDVVKTYIEAGYDGIVITDHFNKRTFGRLPEDASWDEKISHFVSGYNEAVRTAAELAPDFSVILGMELRFYGEDNDYLVYGVSEELLRKSPDIMKLNLEDIRPYIDENDLLIFQAHPFRPDMTIVEPDMLDGIEVYNGNSSHNSSNDIAQMWADKYSLRKTSGSDYHGVWSPAPGGIYFSEKITDSKQLVKALRKGDYKLRTDKD